MGLEKKRKGKKKEVTKAKEQKHALSEIYQRNQLHHMVGKPCACKKKNQTVKETILVEENKLKLKETQLDKKE